MSWFRSSGSKSSSQPTDNMTELPRRNGEDADAEEGEEFISPESTKRIAEMAKRFVEELKISEKESDEVDRHGNTALYRAARAGDLEEVQKCIERGENPHFTNPNGRSIMEVAVLNDSATLLAHLYAASARHSHQRWENSLPVFLQLLAAVPDFRMSLHWKIKSWIPFVSMLAPSDTYTLTKKGDRIRVDYTLQGYRNLRARRGESSILFIAERDVVTASLHSSLHFVDHTHSHYVNALHNASTTSASDISPEHLKQLSESLLSEYSLNTTVTAGEIVPRCDRRGRQRCEKIGRWETRIWEVRDIEIMVERRKCRSVEEMKRRLRREVEAERERERADEGLYWEKNTEEREAENASESEKGREAVKAGKKSADDDTEGEREREVGSDEDDSREERTPITTGSGKSDPSEKKPKVFRHSIRPLLWIAPTFPIRTEHLQAILSVFAPVNERMRRIQEFIASKVPPGFPVKFEVPIVPGVAAVISVTDFQELDETDETYMDVPPTYEQKFRAADGTLIDEDPRTGSSSPPSGSVSGERMGSAGKGQMRVPDVD